MPGGAGDSDGTGEAMTTGGSGGSDGAAAGACGAAGEIRALWLAGEIRSLVLLVGGREMSGGGSGGGGAGSGVTEDL
jgi:hypothetical protein